MICEKCGIVYEGNFCPNGCNSPAAMKKAKKPITKKWWFWVIIALAAIVVISSAGGDEEAPAGTDTNVSASAGDNTEETTETTVADDPYYYAGDVIDANGLKITYVSAEKWEDYNQFSAPDDGYMYIRLYISAENTANTDRYLSFAEFDCYADGVKADSYIFADDMLSTDNVSSGRKLEGYIYFTVPADAEEIEVEYETSFWTDKKAIMKVELQ